MATQVSGQDLLVGLELGHYRVLEKIGAGGMGEVYRARDEHLDRDVAIKVLSPGTLSNESARKRFHKEALILSQLEHPNVATIHDFDTDQGVDFLVMEYIPGITLSAKIAKRPLPEKDVIRLGTQLAEGLSAAHDHGVVHRDVKPGNLRLTSDGRLKILDFGLAKLRRTVAGSATTESLTDMQPAGTLPYMAPEQLLGAEIDARTDIHGAGAVLYEMATGQQPFENVERSQLIGAILRSSVVSAADLNPKISLELGWIICKCLEKEPENRYQSAKELATDLRRLASPEIASISALASPRLRKPRKLFITPIAGFALLALLIVVFAADPGRIRTRLFGHSSGTIRSIAVLPLENLSRDPQEEYLVDGLTDELITELTRIKDLRVVSRTSVMHYKGATKSLPEIAQELHVDAIVEGSALREGNHLHLTAQLIQARTDTHLWAESYQRDLNDFREVPDEVAHAIASEIKMKLTQDEQASLATSHSPTFAPQDAYLKGRYYLQQGTEQAMREAKTYFEEAAKLDPNYAPAYLGLADYYSLTNDLSTPVTMRKAKEYVQKALAMDDSLADAHSTLAYIRFYGDWDWEGAEREFKRAIQLRPSYATAHLLYAEFLSEMGRHAQALAEIRAAQELDPVSDTTILAVGWTLFYARDYNQAIEQCRKVLELDPRSVSARDCVASAHLETGAFDQAIAEYRTLVTLTGKDPLRLSSLGCAYASAGKKAPARDVLVQLNGASEIRYVAPFFLASIHAALGDKDKAFSLLEKAYQEHDSYLVRLKIAREMDPLRSDPRFERLLQRMNLDSVDVSGSFR